MTKHQFGGHCKPQFPGKFRPSSFPSPLTRRTASGDQYYTLMEPYSIAKISISNYPINSNLIYEGLACWQDEPCKQTPQPCQPFMKKLKTKFGLHLTRT